MLHRNAGAHARAAKPAIPNFLLAFALLAAALATTPALAFTMTPMSVSLDPSGNGATRSFQLTNDSDESIAIEVTLATRSIDRDGKETQKQAGTDKLFQVYPPQLIVKAHEKRTLRLSWIGDPQPKQELAYRLIVEQLPVEGPKKEDKRGGVINMLLKYVAAIYVTPNGAKPDIDVKDAVVVEKSGKGGSSQRVLKLTLQNRGGAHRVLSLSGIKLGDTPAKLTQDQVASVSGQNLLAKSERRFELAAPANLPKGAVKAELEYKD